MHKTSLIHLCRSILPSGGEKKTKVRMFREAETYDKIKFSEDNGRFEHIIEEKVKTTATAKAIYHYLAKEHGYIGNYSIIKNYIYNLNIEKKKDAVFQFETNPDIQS